MYNDRRKFNDPANLVFRGQGVLSVPSCDSTREPPRRRTYKSYVEIRLITTWYVRRTRSSVHFCLGEFPEFLTLILSCLRSWCFSRQRAEQFGKTGVTCWRVYAHCQVVVRRPDKPVWVRRGDRVLGSLWRRTERTNFHMSFESVMSSTRQIVHVNLEFTPL